MREDHRFGGYIHLKLIPGASAGAGRRGRPLRRPGQRQHRAADAAPTSTGWRPRRRTPPIEETMTVVQRRADEAADETARTMRMPLPFAPAGQTTQMIVGASRQHRRRDPRRPRRDLYSTHRLRRVYYTAFSPFPHAAARRCRSSPVDRLREHRLYEADWLIRHYGFDAERADHRRRAEPRPVDQPQAGLGAAPPGSLPGRRQHRRRASCCCASPASAMRTVDAPAAHPPAASPRPRRPRHAARADDRSASVRDHRRQRPAVVVTPERSSSSRCSSCWHGERQRSATTTAWREPRGACSPTSAPPEQCLAGRGRSTAVLLSGRARDDRPGHGDAPAPVRSEPPADSRCRGASSHCRGSSPVTARRSDGTLSIACCGALRARAPRAARPRSLDPDVRARQDMDAQVRRDEHKMRAFVRFIAGRRTKRRALRRLVSARSPDRPIARRRSSPIASRRCAGRS